MLQISRRADYATRIMLELALQAEDGPISSLLLARRAAVPHSFLHKIVGDLVKAGLVRSIKGPHGGLSLARPLQNINMRHIVEAADGPVCLNACLLRPHECPRDRVCPGHSFWGRMQKNFLEQLEAGTLDLLVMEAKQLRETPHEMLVQYIFEVES
jgi:Rrf2 family transcriptional regulator, iron-sulfur cluster assembly transcription factor